MATRRNPTARRLVAGQSYIQPLPRQYKTLTRSVTLAEPLMQQDTLFTGTELVTVGNPTVVARQKPIVGSIVLLESGRRSTVRESAELAGLHADVDALRHGVTFNLFSKSTPYVVRAISDNGKFVRVTPLLTSRNYSSAVRMREGVFEYVVNQSRYNAEGQLEPVPATAESLTTQINSTVVYEGSQHYNCQSSYARAAHVKEYLTFSQISDVVWKAMQITVRKEVRDRLFARLAKESAAGRPWVTAPTRRSAQRRKTRKEAAADIRDYLQVALAVHDAITDEVNINLLSAMSVLENAVRNYGSNRLGEPNERAAAMVRKFTLKHFGVEYSRAPACGHWHEGAATRLGFGRYGETGEFCPQCAADPISVTDSNGDIVLMQRGTTTYSWTDGTRRMRPEPGIIGGRHSGKGIVGFIPSLLGEQRDNIVTLGLELEMQAINYTDRELYARLLKARVANVLAADQVRKYVHFEEDGSTGQGGFEMVTGYTDLGTHAKLLAAMLNTDDGKPAWNGKLRSHDAKGGSCGIHVHVQKPKHLIHASKLRYFINSASTTQLITDVARRYNDSYARMDNRTLGVTDPGKSAANYLRTVKQNSYVSKALPQHEKSALDRLNAGDRYQALNFQNAHTVEFRIFRGSILHGTVMACLEFSQATWKFCRDTPATSLTVEKFLRWLELPQNRKDTRALRVYLARKGYSVKTANPIKAAPAALETA